MLAEASPLAFAFAVALAVTGEVKLRGCEGSIVAGFSFGLPSLRSGFGVSSEPVSDPDPPALAEARAFGSVGDVGVVSGASRAESSVPARLPAALPLPGRLGSAGISPGAAGVPGAGAFGVDGATSFIASSEPLMSPAASPFAAPLTPASEPLAAPAALPAVFTLPAIPLVAALAAPLAAPVAEALVDDTADDVVPCAASRVLDTRSRTFPVVSRVRSTALPV